MPEVEAFTSDMIKKALDASGLRYLIDSQGDYLVRFPQEVDRPCDIDVWFIAEGENKDIFNLFIQSNIRFVQDKLGDALLACNEWQKIKRWPKAYVSVDNTGGSSQVILEFQLLLESGIHQELFTSLAINILATSLEFWKWAHGERHLY